MTTMAPWSRSPRNLGRFAEVGVLGDEDEQVLPRELADHQVGRVLPIVVTNVSGVPQQLRHTMREIGVKKELHYRTANGSSRSWTAAAAYSR